MSRQKRQLLVPGILRDLVAGMIRIAAGSWVHKCVPRPIIAMELILNASSGKRLLLGISILG